MREGGEGAEVSNRKSAEEEKEQRVTSARVRRMRRGYQAQECGGRAEGSKRRSAEKEKEQRVASARMQRRRRSRG